MTRVLPLLLTLVVLGQQIRLSWTAHPDNAWVWISYQCDKTATRPAFWAVNAFEIGAEDTARTIRRVTTPAGQRCWIAGHVLRTYPEWDGDGDTLLRAEYSAMPYTEGD